MIIAGLIHALPPADRRVFSRSEAASYVGVSAGFFDKLVRDGGMPPALAMRGVRRWDKRALDRVLDTVSGIEASPASAYDAWKANHG